MKNFAYVNYPSWFHQMCQEWLHLPWFLWLHEQKLCLCKLALRNLGNTKSGICIGKVAKATVAVLILAPWALTLCLCKLALRNLGNTQSGICIGKVLQQSDSDL